MNVLITSVGSLSAPFVIKSVKEIGFKAVGIDIYERKWVAVSPDLDAFEQVPLTMDQDYTQRIISICLTYSINIILPLTDIDVDYYAKMKDFFLRNYNIILAVSSKNAVEIMRNKYKIYEIFKNNKIVKTIPTFYHSDYMNRCSKFPCVAKKIKGRSSEGLMILYEEKELNLSIFQKDEYIFQPFLEGAIYVADLLRDNKNQLIYMIREELLRTKNGAGLTVRVTTEKLLDKTIYEIAKSIYFKGCINIEFIKSGETFYLMDINPRFSAGIVFSNMAGYNFVINHLRVFTQQEIDLITTTKKDLIISRKYVELIV